jgi:hypothetical protein
MSTRPSTTLADLFTLRARADLFSAVWASLRWRSGDERHDGVTDGRQAWSRRWSVDTEKGREIKYARSLDEAKAWAEADLKGS